MKNIQMKGEKFAQGKFYDRYKGLTPSSKYGKIC